MTETPDSSHRLIIVGAGHAGSELAVSARQQGWAGSIVLLGEEPDLPYHRPPLSKAYLCGDAALETLALRARATYEAASIDLRLGTPVARIDRVGKQLILADGSTLAYERLALCTGGRPRVLVCPGLAPDASPPNLLYLRTRSDADRIRERLGAGQRLVVIGAGYVGLEVAASARKLGAEVTVLESQGRVLSRVSGEPVSRFYEAVHRAAGVDLRTGATIEHIECEGGQVRAVRCADGSRIEADVVLAGIGMAPNVTLAQEAGLADETGILVDEFACTSDPAIVAAGDCTVHDSVGYGRRVRLESVPNALEQARAAAAWLAGKPKANTSVPWFWSDQYDLKLQMAGLSQGHDTCVIRGSPEARKFAAIYLRQGRLLAIDAVNSPMDFMAVRKALAGAPQLDAARLADATVPLKDVLQEPLPLTPAQGLR